MTGRSGRVGNIGGNIPEKEEVGDMARNIRILLVAAVGFLMEIGRAHV